MTVQRRVSGQPAFLLHYRPFRDTSLLLDVFSRDHGKIALVARGARSARSRLKGLLRPFLPLSLSWIMRGDLGTLTGAELSGKPVTLSGDGLLSGYYLNELILQFLHRHDAQPEVFSAYQETVIDLASQQDPAPVLRDFEMELLRLIGYALNFEHDAATHADIEHGASYEYRYDRGPVRVERVDGDMVFTGATLIAIREHRFGEPGVLRAANRLLRRIISHHLGGRELKSRKVLLDLHRGRAKMASPK